MHAERVHVTNEMRLSLGACADAQDIVPLHHYCVRHYHSYHCCHYYYYQNHDCYHYYYYY